MESKEKLIIGCCLIIYGLIYTKSIRDYLFISRPNGLLDKSHEMIGNHIYLFQNFYNLFFNNFFTINIINSVFILGSAIYFMCFFWSSSDSQIKALIVYCAIITNILIFGLVNETRMYIILIPFIIFFCSSSSRE